MADNARGIHVSPGIYTKETELSYAVKSLGITTLGLVGETVKGPAFQPMAIENWREFQDVFGGTSAEKFVGSQYPKYELPYVAKSYLTESNQLQVCRVLGLSGYNAGPAWAITAQKKDSTEKMVVAVLRSRGHYDEVVKVTGEEDKCNCPDTIYDQLVYDAVKNNTTAACQSSSYENHIKLTPYKDFNGSYSCTGTTSSASEAEYDISPMNYGKFTITSYVNGTEGDVDFEYAVTLNPSDKDYILKVLGTNPQNGTTKLYVESLYDVALEQGIIEGTLEKINGDVEFYNVYDVDAHCTIDPVMDFLSKDAKILSRKDVGRRFLCDGVETDAWNGENATAATKTKIGYIYQVAQRTTTAGTREYFYKEAENIVNDHAIVKVNIDGRYWGCVTKETSSETGEAEATAEKVAPVTCDLNNYREGYRFASTPWFVSNVKGDANKMEVNKLFRFHTISDGDAANNEVKVSIQNIKPDQLLFDVVIRDINDTDEMPVVLEKFSKCSMVPTSHNYIAYQIGSADGTYEVKSKYVTVEVNETLAARNSVPCGFLGYPLIQFGGMQINSEKKNKVVPPTLKYNTLYDEDVKHRKQYFGLSTSVGVDIDAFTYKGHAAYGEAPDYLSNGFHLDCRVTPEYSEGVTGTTILVDGEKDYKFDGVSMSNATESLQELPIIATEAEMEGSLYEYVDLRKFTAYFYGGFDGWDIYRESRSNTDNFKMNKYRGHMNTNGEGKTFNRLEAPESLNLNQQGITSDWYAYLGAIRQFANPESVDINVFATPGIDLINNKLLVEEAIEMIEEERADSIYVVTTPDKPFSASDHVDEMYTPDDVVAELEDSQINSSYACTYYPWVKYEDKDNSQYIFLPPTKDVVRNMAKTDNQAHPWFAPAGINRGEVDCVRAHYITKLADEDVLYNGRINPIKTFATDGAKIWGQKNLQEGESMLNRIAVRRLLLRMRKLISIACLGLIFEPNDATTKNTFLSIVTPIMDDIKANRGISDYRIEVNDTVESRQRRELPAKIYFKPYSALEYVDLNFIVTPEGVSFDAI